jgi:ATP-dependent helicase HrpB
MKLPIEDVIDDIKEVLSRQRYTVVQAPPGAGKTTLVPLALLDEVWLSGKKIIMLEPRRIAVRAAAGRMAELLNEKVGKTVGYHVRMDRVVGPKTRIEVVTEGILTRRIQNDPSLEGVGLIIFDEFHERNLNSDLGLALTMESCEVFCDKLRVLVMSATLDGERVSQLMGDAPVITSKGKSWPVKTRYVPLEKNRSYPGQLVNECAALIQRVVAGEDGDILVFLPGVYEIKRVETILNDNLKVTGKKDTNIKDINNKDQRLSIVPLFGNLTKEQQDFAISPSQDGFRKIVLSTPIAETSITIDGISIVIDSGLMRVPKYFSGTGMGRLETISVSKSSADQRRGRAGRTKPGICYRMWAESHNGMLKEFNTPEILNTDLTAFVLELAAWGVTNISDLKLLDLPPESSVKQAKEILVDLGALDPNGMITTHGKKMTGPGIHPRLAHMIIKGDNIGCGSLACHIAAILSERDFIIFKDRNQDADISLRLEILKIVRGGRKFSDRNITLNHGVLKRILRDASRFEKIIKTRYDLSDITKAGNLLAFAYPERIMQMGSGTEKSIGVNGIMASGKRAFLQQGDSLTLFDYIVIASLDGKTSNSRIYLGAPYSKEDLIHDFKDKLETVITVKWDKRSKGVIAKKELKYGALVLEREGLKDIDQELLSSKMIDGINEMGLSSLPWNKKLRSFQARAVFLYRTGKYKNFPDIRDTRLIDTLDSWLKPFIQGVSKASQLKKIDLKSALDSHFTWENKQKIKVDAPSSMLVPSGSILPLKYPEKGEDLSPVLAVRLQELFGLEETPRVANGEPITIHLLSPASRPVQVTKDLKNFWKTTYGDVKKELKGRYPKHYWPDDPLKAMPTNRVKKKR